jgi:DHA2 family metal-tetracycline-proton antiporter-like MFS transporter
LQQQETVHTRIDESVRTKLVAVLSVALFFSVMNGSMFVVALPDIAREFALRPSQAGWVITAYAIVFALGSMTYGKLADIYSLRKLITVGVSLFATGSLLGLFSNGFAMLIAARFVQSLGASAIPALAMLIPIRYFPFSERGRVLGIAASSIAFGAGIGPLTGGLVTGLFHWRYLFLVSLGMFITLPFFRLWLADDPKKEGSFDFIGAFTMAVAVAALLLVITNYSLWLLIVAVVAFVLFILRVNTARNPFIQPALLANRYYRNALISGFLAMGTAFGIMFLVPLMLSNANQLNTAIIGMVMFPGAMTAAVMGRQGGKLADRIGSISVVYMALALLLTGFIALSTFAGSSIYSIALSLIVGNTGFAFMQASLAKVVSTTLPHEQAGVGMGIYNLMNFMAGAVSVTVLSKLLDATSSAFSINPLALKPAAFIYSNLFFGLAIVTLVNLSMFYLTFKRFEGSQA